MSENSGPIGQAARDARSRVFSPEWSVVGRMDDRFADLLDQVGRESSSPAGDLIRKEPMLLQASFAYARAHGGPLTQAFLDAILESTHLEVDLLVDSKVTMLMEGMYPAIPGWHHDTVVRTGHAQQPDYEAMHSGLHGDPVHYMAHLGSVPGLALPEFVTENVEVPVPPPGVKVYKAWDRYLEALRPARKVVREGEIVRFTWRSFHRAMPAQMNGWRFWIRATVGSRLPVRNEIRTQVQVYLSDLSEGW